MKLITYFVSPNEPAFNLFEGPTQVPQQDGSTADHWVQDIVVIRNDQRAHYLTDFGPVEDFEMVTPIIVPSPLGENTVQELQFWAEKNRHDTYWQEVAARQRAESTLIQDVINHRFQIHEMIHNRSQIGPVGIYQRDGYDRQANWRRWMDTRAERTGKRVFTA
jgi:hypothetical protein